MRPTTVTIDPKILAFYLTYQFVPKQSNNQFPKTHNPLKTFKQSEAWIAKGLCLCLENIIKASLTQASGPVGLLLSGGMDSAILLYMLSKNTSKKIYTISAAYASDKSHLKLCASLAQKYGTAHQELIITPTDLLKLSRMYSLSLEAPIGDNGFLATYLMLKALPSHLKTIYTGDGADCLFHGLQAHYLEFLDRKSIHRLLPSTKLAQKFFLPNVQYPEYEHYKYDEIFLTKKEAQEYLGMDLDLSKPLKTAINTIKAKDPIKRTMLLDLNFLVVNRVDYILSAAAANKVRVLLPFLDSALVNYALRIPSQYFIKNHQQKYILKKAFEDKLPASVIFQRKKGMTPPFLEWYTQNQSFVLKTLKKAQDIGVATPYIHYLIKNIHRSNQYAYGMRIWLILNLVLWYRPQRALKFHGMKCRSYTLPP